MDMPSLTAILDTFNRAFDIGRSGLAHDVAMLFRSIVIIEIIFAGLYFALSSSENSGTIVKKVLQIAVIHSAIQNYDWLLKIIIDGFLYAGAAAGAQTNLSINTLRDPDLIFTKGLELVQPALERVAMSSKESWIGAPDSDSIIILLCALISIFAFSIMAIQVFVTYLEYLLVVAVGFILVPFAIFKPTEYLVRKLVGSLIGFGIKLMTLSLVIAVSVTIMQQVHVTTDIHWNEAFTLVLISMSLCFLSWHAPSLCLSLFTGYPTLTSAAVSNSARDAREGYKLAKEGAQTISNGIKSAAVTGAALASKARDSYAGRKEKSSSGTGS